MQSKQVIVIIALLLCISQAAGKWIPEYSGYIDTLYGVNLHRLEQRRALKWRLHGQGSLQHNNHTLYAALDFAHNHHNSNKSNLTLKEAYWEWAGEHMDMRLGRQIIAWGKADGLAVTDIISPKDHRQYFAQDYQDTRLAVDALTLRYLGNTMTLEAIWIALPAFERLPSHPRNPLSAIMQPSSTFIDSERVPIRYYDNNKPNSLKDSEWALRSSFYLPSMDVSLTWFHGWDRKPWKQQQHINVNEIKIDKQYHKMDMFGIDAAVAAGDWVWRAEGAWFKARQMTRLDGRKQKTNQTMLLGGFDWNSGNWIITGQYLYDAVSNSQALSRRGVQNTATLSASKQLLRDTLSLEGGAYFDLDNGGGAYSLEADYAVNDNYHIIGGINSFDAAKTSRFYPLRSLSTLWLKMKYSF